MEKRNIFLKIILSVMMIFLLVGCGNNRKAITTEEFENKAKSHNYTIIDATAQYKDSEFVDKATLASNASNWKVEFYILKDKNSAASVYEYNKEDFIKSKGNGSKETSESIGNYSNYSLTTNGNYKYLSKIDNTLIYVVADEKYTEDIKGFVQELGY